MADAAVKRGLSLAALLAAIEEALRSSPDRSAPMERDWYAAPLGELIGYIVAAHHAYMKTALPRLRVLVPTVLNAHGEHHGDALRPLQDIFNALDAEISSHLMKEEQVLFPYLAALESHVRSEAPMPQACFASARNPIRQMEHEHENAGQALARLRAATNEYRYPPVLDSGQGRGVLNGRE